MHAVWYEHGAYNTGGDICTMGTVVHGDICMHHARMHHGDIYEHSLVV